MPQHEDIADPRQVRDKTRKEKLGRAGELADFIEIMNTPAGRRFIWRLLELTGFQKSSFTGNSTTFFNEGMRNVGLIIWADLQERPDLLVQMMNEARLTENRNA